MKKFIYTFCLYSSFVIHAQNTDNEFVNSSNEKKDSESRSYYQSVLMSNPSNLDTKESDVSEKDLHSDSSNSQDKDFKLKSMRLVDGQLLNKNFQANHPDQIDPIMFAPYRKELDIKISDQDIPNMLLEERQLPHNEQEFRLMPMRLVDGRLLTKDFQPNHPAKIDPIVFASHRKKSRIKMSDEDILKILAGKKNYPVN